MKRITALLLAIISFVYLCPVAVFAYEPGKYRVVTTALNLRAEPVSGTVIDSLHYGDEIDVTEISEGWAKTEWKGKTGWCSMRYLVCLDGVVYEISESGLDLIKGFEGFSEYAYWDYSQWTIGYGTRCEENEYPNGITEEEAQTLLREAIVSYEMSVNAFLGYYGIDITQNQYDALVSLTYNIGSNWTGDSTLSSYLKEGVHNYSPEEITAAFCEFVHAGGEVIPGLVTRRTKEAEYFLSDEHFHSYKPQNGTEPTCTADGEMTYSCYCGSVYTEKLEKTGHIPSDLMVTLEPTKENTGLKISRCIICTEEISHIEIPKIMPDVNENSWYFEGVKHCVTEGYIEGNSKGLFDPNSALTREQFVVILARVANADVSAYEAGNFKDVRSSAWYADHVNWAAANGYVKGIGNGDNFGVGRNITRQELCVMFYRYAEAVGLDVSADFELKNYSDHSKIASWAKEEVSFAATAGLMSSTTQGKLTFAPTMSVTRAQAAKIFMSFDLYRFAQ